MVQKVRNTPAPRKRFFTGNVKPGLRAASTVRNTCFSEKVVPDCQRDLAVFRSSTNLAEKTARSLGIRPESGAVGFLLKRRISRHPGKSRISQKTVEKYPNLFLFPGFARINMTESSLLRTSQDQSESLKL